MAFEVMWSDLAVANLEEIFTYISKDNPRAGRQVLQRIVNKVETLREIPFLEPCILRMRTLAFARCFAASIEFSTELTKLQSG
jgi:hypothetical protein